MKSPVERIVERLGIPALVDALGSQLSGADLTSLLLEVMRRRAAAVKPAQLMRQYAGDRFVAPTTLSFRSLRRVEDALLAACPGDVDIVALAPLVPLGAHSAIATVDQHKIVTTVRQSEVAADPTNALALEASVRRRAALQAESKSRAVVRLGASQRVVRAQHVSGPARFAHFQLFGLLTAGRDDGGYTFEAASASEHLLIHTRALAALGANRITVYLTDFAGGRAGAIVDAVRRSLNGAMRVTCVDDPERASGRGYYRDFCFKVYAQFETAAFKTRVEPSDEKGFETSDGGCVDWTRRLLGSAKERCFISGIGVDRLALASAPS